MKSLLPSKIIKRLCFACCLLACAQAEKSYAQESSAASNAAPAANTNSDMAAWLTMGLPLQDSLRQACANFRATGCEAIVTSRVASYQAKGFASIILPIMEAITALGRSRENAVNVEVVWKNSVPTTATYTLDSIFINTSKVSAFFPAEALKTFLDTLLNHKKETASQVSEITIDDKIVTALKILQKQVKGVTVSEVQLQSVFPNTDNATLATIAATVTQYAGAFGLTTVDRMANFLAQTGYESDGFKAKNGENGCYKSDNINGWKIWFAKTWREPSFGTNCDTSLNPAIKNKKKLKWTAVACDTTGSTCVAVPAEFVCGSGNALTGDALTKKFFNYVYQCEGGNGNSASEEGHKYSGHGAIQLTWKKNYEAFDRWLKENYKEKYKNVVANSNLIDTDKELFVLSAMWYWNTNGLNNDADKGDLKSITLKINSGGEGKNTRENYTNQLKQQLK
jgi:predicted chitinase